MSRFLIVLLLVAGCSSTPLETVDPNVRTWTFTDGSTRTSAPDTVNWTLPDGSTVDLVMVPTFESPSITLWGDSRNRIEVFNDGRVEFHGDLGLDDAAKMFWSAVGRNAPCRCD